MSSKIGRKVFYDVVNGNVIMSIPELQGFYIEKSIDEEISSYMELSERNRDTFGVLELPFGAYSQDFAECNGYRVNVETKTLEFSYPDPNEPTLEQPHQAPLSEKVKQLELAQSVTDTTLLELMESLLQ